MCSGSRESSSRGCARACRARPIALARRRPQAWLEKPLYESRIALGDGKTPLDVGLAIMRTAFAAGDMAIAAELAVKLAPYFHQKFGATDREPAPHPEQGLLPLFGEADSKHPTFGKKEAAARAAETAGDGSDWGNLLYPDRRH